MHPAPMVLAGLGPAEVLIILLVLVLLFGAKKLPELARGSGQALRIFKSETGGLLEDEDTRRNQGRPHRDAASRQSDGDVNGRVS
jgi:sec-independent protein translocase protein TatA